MGDMLGNAIFEYSKMDPPMLTVGMSTAESFCVFTLCGELNGASFPALDAQIDQIDRSNCMNVILDITGLSKLDPVGERVLIGLCRYVRELGASPVVTGAHGQVAKTLAPICLVLGHSPPTPWASRQRVAQPPTLTARVSGDPATYRDAIRGHLVLVVPGGQTR